MIATAAAVAILFGRIPDGLLDTSRYSSVRVVDRQGVVLFESLSSTGSRSEWLRADALPRHLVHATLAAEDRRFYEHRGISVRAIARAILHNVRSGRVVEGGSTITQQVAKLLLQNENASRRTFAAKLKETVLAVRLERKFSKDEILALYLNLAPYGNRIRGAQRASRAYFGVDAGDLTIAQSAFLASLPQRPSAFNPFRDPSRARQRQQTVIALMEQAKWITAEDVNHARSERLAFSSLAQPVVARHFVERVLERSGLSPDAPGVHVVRTTLDAALQREVAGIIAAHRANLVKHGARAAAVAVLDNASGEWLAWEGSGDYFGDKFGGAIDGVVTPRQPGSTLKPFTYAVAFEQGHSPATVLADVPSHFATAEEGVAYTPRNYDGRYRGPLTVRASLAGSENVPAVAMLSKVGPAALLRLLRGAGFDGLTRTADYYGLGLTLGDAEVTLEQLVTAYAAFARGGESIEPHFLREAKVAAPKRIVSERTAFWISDILADSKAREFIFGEGGSLDFPFTVAAKTGTSQAYRDNWTIGFTRDVTVGVWVGNFDRDELRNSSGVTGAAPIFNAVMLAATKRARGTLPIGDGTPIVAPPASVEKVAVCSLSGLRPSPSCPATRDEWLPREAAATFCSWHHADGVDWPAEYRPWAKTAGLLDARPQVAGATSHHDDEFRVVSPANGSTFMIDPTLRREYQALRLRAASRGSVAWAVDGRRIGAAGEGGHVEWPLVPGRHTIRATDARGESDSVTIFVK